MTIPDSAHDLIRNLGIEWAAEAIQHHIEIHKENFYAKQGLLFAINIEKDGKIWIPVDADLPTDQLTGMSNRLVIEDRNQERFRLCIPTRLLLDYETCSIYSLYRIRFDFNPQDDSIDRASMLPFRHGYFGITRRSIWQRFNEHLTKMKCDEGHLLHKSWASLVKNKIEHLTILELGGFASTLEKIYEFEEKVVADISLAPKGLNMIPGGMAGIRELHRLGFSKKVGKLPLHERDAILEKMTRITSAKCTHFRSGHFRNLSPQRKTWVSSTWVNLKAAA